MPCPFAHSGSSGAAPPPELAGDPIVGNLFEFIRTPFECLADGALAHGTIFRLRLAGKPMTVLWGPEAAALVEQGTAGPLTREGLYGAFSTETSVDLFTLEGSSQRTLRALLQRGYSRQSFGQFAGEIVRRLERHVRGLGARGRIELTDLCAELAVRAIAYTLSPVDLSPLVPDVERFGNDVMGVIVGVRPPAIFRLPGYRAAKARLERTVDTTVARHVRGEFGAGDVRPYMIDSFLRARSADGQALTARDVRGGCLYALCGAHTYVGPLAAFMVYEITRDRVLRSRVLAEIDEALLEQPVDPIRFRQMPHLRAAYFETLRRYPLVFGLAFRAARDFEFGGYRVPRGEAILISPVPMHLNPELYAKPFSFDTRRFLGGRHTAGPGAYAPFGMAPRTCPAAGMVELLMMVTVASILRNAELRLPQVSYQAGAELRPLPQPADGLPMMIRAIREPSKAATGALEAFDLGDPFSRVPDGIPRADIQPIRLSECDNIVAPRPEDGAVYVVLDGALQSIGDNEAAPGGEVAIAPGDVIGYGDRSGQPHKFRALVATRLLPIDAADFDAVLCESDFLARELGRVLQWRYMRGVLARALPGVDLRRIQEALPELQVCHFGVGTEIFRQGDAADHVYIVLSGELEVIREQLDGTTHRVGQLGTGEAFGEIGVLHCRPRGATVRVRSDDAVVLVLGRSTIDRLLRESPEARQGLALTASQRLLAWIESIEAKHARPSD